MNLVDWLKKPGPGMPVEVALVDCVDAGHAVVDFAGVSVGKTDDLRRLGIHSD